MRWIVGDIHGMLRPLRALLEAVFRADSSAQLIFVGDYVNRGPESRGVVELLLSLRGARFIRGNHDDIFDQVLNGECYAENTAEYDRLVSFQWFMQHGLDHTFMSYGADFVELQHAASRPSPERLQMLVDYVPQTHREFFRQLLPAVEEEDIFVTHGRWDPDEPDLSPGIVERLAASPARRYQLLWGRYTPEEVVRRKAWRRTGYFGHTPTYTYPAADADSEVQPLVGHNIVLLDTAAALLSIGRLTAFCADNRTYIQADRFGEVSQGSVSS